MADKRPTKTKLPETKIDLELPTSKGELVPYKKPEGGLSDTSQGKRATRNIAKGRGSAKRRALSALLELLVGTAVTEEPSISELPVFHGGAEHPNFETELYFVSPSASQAKEYGKEHGLTSVFQYTVDPNKIADEDIARSVIKKLGITPKGGWTVDDSLLFEMIDPNFDQYIGKKNVSKLIKEMKKDGFIGIKYLDEDMVSGRKAGIANIVLFEIPKLKGKSSGGLVGLI